MKKITLFFLMSATMVFSLQAQRKSDLIAEIDTLKSALRAVNDSLAKLQRVASANAPVDQQM